MHQRPCSGRCCGESGRCRSQRANGRRVQRRTVAKERAQAWRGVREMKWNRADSGGCQAGTVPGSGVQGAGVSAIRKTACNRLTGVASACSGKANRKSRFQLPRCRGLAGPAQSRPPIRRDDRQHERGPQVDGRPVTRRWSCPTALRQIANVARHRRLELQRVARHRMRQRQTPGVQRLTGQRRMRLTVRRVTRDRPPARGQMHADLVRPPGDQLAADE